MSRWRAASSLTPSSAAYLRTSSMVFIEQECAFPMLLAITNPASAQRLRSSSGLTRNPAYWDDKSDALDDFDHLRTNGLGLRQLNLALWHHPNLAGNACEHGVARTDLVPSQDSLRFHGQLYPKPFVT